MWAIVVFHDDSLFMLVFLNDLNRIKADQDGCGLRYRILCRSVWLLKIITLPALLQLH
jgi:hypothetical protein